MENKNIKNLISNKIIFPIIIGALLLFGLPLSFPISGILCEEHIGETSGLTKCEGLYIGIGALLTLAGIVIILAVTIYLFVKIFKKEK